MIVGVILLLSLLVDSAIYLNHLPWAGRYLGHDWSIGLPVWLNGFYWVRENGLWEVPWATPAKCGAYPFFATEGFYSLGSVLSWVMPPVLAAQVTFVVFTGLGALGFYLVLRKSLGLSVVPALLGAALFMFNGFSGHRMIIGHFGFHGFLLMPWIALIAIECSKASRLSRWQGAALIGLMITYMVHCPMLQILPPTLLCVAAILVFDMLLNGFRKGMPWVVLFWGVLFSMALSLSKLVAFQSLMAQFPRTYYPLPGVEGFGRLIQLTLEVLFSQVPDGIDSRITNSAFLIQRHEWEYGLSPLPVLLMVLVLLADGEKIWAQCSSALKVPLKAAALGVLGFLMLLPLLLNWYQPQWNAFLKTLPFLGSSSNLIRWMILYIPMVLILAALSLDRLLECFRISQSRAFGVLALSLIGLFLWTLRSDFSYYNQSYLSAPVEDAWHRGKAGEIPKVHAIADVVRGNGPNDGIVMGVSAIQCYEPTMGYGLEKFPVGALHSGPVFPEDKASVNLKNPACYLYPEENQCHPGDHFTLEQREEAEKLVAYKPFRFEFSKRQLWANRVTTLSLLLALIILVLPWVLKWFMTARARDH